MREGLARHGQILESALRAQRLRIERQEFQNLAGNPGADTEAHHLRLCGGNWIIVRPRPLGELLCEAVRLLARQSSLEQLARRAPDLRECVAPDVGEDRQRRVNRRT